MSRSRKRIPIVKDPANSPNKKISSRRARRASKLAVNSDKEVVPTAKEVTNQYDVCDFKIFGYGKEFIAKFKRK